MPHLRPLLMWTGLGCNALRALRLTAICSFDDPQRGGEVHVLEAAATIGYLIGVLVPELF